METERPDQRRETEFAVLMRSVGEDLETLSTGAMEELLYEIRSGWKGEASSRLQRTMTELQTRLCETAEDLFKASEETVSLICRRECAEYEQGKPSEGDRRN